MVFWILLAARVGDAYEKRLEEGLRMGMDKVLDGCELGCGEWGCGCDQPCSGLVKKGGFDCVGAVGLFTI